MSDSIREQFCQNLQTRLGEISAGNETVLGSGIRYTHTIANVQREDQEDPNFEEVPFIMLAIIREAKDDSNPEQIFCQLNIDIQVWTRHDKVAFDYSSQKLLNELQADVEKAILYDRTFSGIIEDIDIAGNFPFEREVGETHIGVVVSADADYKHGNKDPDSLFNP